MGRNKNRLKSNMERIMFKPRKWTKEDEKELQEELRKVKEGKKEPAQTTTLRWLRNFCDTTCCDGYEIRSIEVTDINLFKRSLRSGIIFCKDISKKCIELGLVSSPRLRVYEKE